MFDNVSTLQSNITIKWPPGNEYIYVSQKKSNAISLCICYIKVNLSTLFGIVCIYSSFFSDILMTLKDPSFKNCERIYTIFFFKIKFLDMFV